MKTLNSLNKTLCVGLLMFSTLLALSNTSPEKSKTGAMVTEKTIRDYFKFPQVLLNHEQEVKKETQKVEVLFTTDKSGLVNFVLAKTNDTNLKAEIEKQFIGLRFKNLKSEVVNSVTLNFKML